MVHWWLLDCFAILTSHPSDSFQGTVEFDMHGRPRCKNQDRLLEFILDSKILLNDRRTPDVRTRSETNVKKEINPMLAAVKIICSSLLFELDDLKHHVFAVEQLQRAAYASTNSAPIYEGLYYTDINMAWVMKCLDFFRYHMMDRQTMTLSDAMEDLSALQKPTAWQEPLRNGALPLSKHWKGTYSFLDPREQKKLRTLPDDDDSDTYYSDHNIDEGKIQVFTKESVEMFIY